MRQTPSRIAISAEVARAQAAERRVAEILGRIRDGFVAFDRDWHYVFVNERAGELLGRNPADLMGKVYLEEFPEALGTPFQVAYARAMEEQVALTVEEHFAPWDRWFENRIYPSEGGIAILFSEISERKHAEQALRRSEHQLRTTLEHLPLLGAILDTEGRITFCNDHLLTLTGWTREEVLGREWFSTFIPPEVRSKIESVVFSRPMETGEMPIHYENEIITRHGERRLVAWNNTVLRDSGNRVTGVAGMGEDITEQRRRDRALLDVTAALERAEAQAHLGSWRLDVGTGAGRWSDEMFRLLRLDPDGGIPGLEAYLEAIHPEDRALVRAAYDALVAGVDPTPATFRTNPVAGAVRYLDPTFHRVLDEAGLPLAFEGTLLDVTERELAARELQATTDVLRRTGALARVGGWTLEVPSLDLSWNEEIDRIHEGAAEGSPTLELALGFYAPESRRLLESAIQAAITTATPWDLELRVITMSGRHIWVRSMSNPVLEGGTVVRLVGATQEITERKAAQDAAETLLERLTLATAEGGVGIFDWDLATNTWYGTPAYFGEPEPEPEEGAGPSAWLERVHPDDRDALASMIRAMLAGNDAPFAHDARLSDDDGSYRWVSLSGRVVTRGEGRPGRLLGVVHDITDRMTLEARLRQAHKLETMGQFASILAHDLRNYLHAISWSVDHLARDTPEADPRRQDLVQIRAAVDGGMDMVRNVLGFARPGTGGGGVTDLRAHLDQVGGIVTRLVGSAVTLETDIADDLPPLAIEPAGVTQALFNLAANARDAMPDGGVFRVAAALRVVTPTDAATDELPPGRYVRVEVSDTGEGMDAATARRAFEPFHTTKDDEGTGLGLASVYLIVTRAGGSVAVTSELGVGTVVTIDVPAAG